MEEVDAAPPWAQVMGSIHRSGLNREKWVLAVVLAFYNTRTGRCDPSLETIAAAARLDVKTARAHLKWLSSPQVPPGKTRAYPPFLHCALANGQSYRFTPNWSQCLRVAELYPLEVKRRRPRDVQTPGSPRGHNKPASEGMPPEASEGMPPEASGGMPFEASGGIPLEASGGMPLEASEGMPPQASGGYRSRHPGDAARGSRSGLYGLDLGSYGEDGLSEGLRPPSPQPDEERDHHDRENSGPPSIDYGRYPRIGG